MQSFDNKIEACLVYSFGVTPKEATLKQLYSAISLAAQHSPAPAPQYPSKKRACYFSAEFLMGRLIHNNLMNLGLLAETDSFLRRLGKDMSMFEEVTDHALGNGGLGRLAACFLDSAATHNIPLDGYGIRYRYGLFAQTFQDGFQMEAPDDWTRYGDPWSVRKEEDTVTVKFGDYNVLAVPYDMPVIGYGGTTVNTLRLWQSEAENGFDFDSFNQQKYDEAVKEQNRAQSISAVLYPNDDTPEGKRLRLRQQYFFSSASLQSIVSRFVKEHGSDFSKFPSRYAIQLNDTHPVVAIPELMRILMQDYLLPFEQAFEIAKNTFAYTNHTVMSEALEKWDTRLFSALLPEVYPYIVFLDQHLRRMLCSKDIQDHTPYQIILDGQIHMARLAIFATHSTNGVAQIHTKILKEELFSDWDALYPDRLNNKTNGITQRRWLALCNPELSAFITAKIGSGWIRNLTELEKLRKFSGDNQTLADFRGIKRQKKQQLCDYILEHEGIQLNPEFIFDIQVKRLHEYKRQLLNALSILDLYFGIKDSRVHDFHPTAFIFGAKAAPGYRRAKGIIKLINEISKLIAADPQASAFLQVVFVQNYTVSYAEKLIPAADVSEQISAAGTEASGTGNMKLMLNGAVTLGTLDGANVEIVEQAGFENNYIFGATVEQLRDLKDKYNPRAIYEGTPRLRRVVDALVDGTLDDGGTGMFRELYDSLLKGASWHQPDQYFLFEDFIPYCSTRLSLNRDYQDYRLFARKCFMNTASAGKFSSDRTIRQYNEEIWHCGQIDTTTPISADYL